MEKIRPEDKKLFLKDLLRTFPFKSREREWIRRVLMPSEQILQKLNFIDDPENLSNVIILSPSSKVVTIQLITKDEIITGLVEINEALRNSPANKKFYFYIKTRKNLYNINSYIKVLQENKKATLPAECRTLADKVVKHLTKELEIKHLSKEIDKALDENNEKLFKSYVKKLNELKK